MSDESRGFDPYDVVIADLKAKRDQIDKIIQSLEAVRGGVPTGAASTQVPGDPGASQTSLATGSLLGMSIADAAKQVLRNKHKPLSNPEIVAEFKAGGFILGSKDPVNTVGAVLTRRANENGDIVKVGRGTFGLKEWFPGRSFGKKDQPKNGGSEKGGQPTDAEGEATAATTET